MTAVRAGAPKVAVIGAAPPPSRPVDAPSTRLTLQLARAATLCLFALVLVALSYRIAQYLIEAWRAVGFPFALDWMEGAVWQQAMLIPGPRMYGPVDAPPYLFFEYPLVYHLAIKALTVFGGDPLKIGRALSVACTLAIAGMCGILVHRAMRHAVGRPARMLGAIVAAFVPLTYHPVTSWSQQMRVDMLGVAFSFAGVTLAVLAARRPALLWPAMAAFVLAVYTKQVEVAAPMAALAVAFILNWRQAMPAALAGLGMACIALLALEWMTDGGFLRHIVLYNTYPPFSLSAALSLAARVYLAHAVYFAAAMTGLVLVWLREIRSAVIRPAPNQAGARKFADTRAGRAIARRTRGYSRPGAQPRRTSAWLPVRGALLARLRPLPCGTPAAARCRCGTHGRCAGLVSSRVGPADRVGRWQPLVPALIHRAGDQRPDRWE